MADAPDLGSGDRKVVRVQISPLPYTIKGAFMNYFFTADEHYFHKNVIKYCNRPFANLEEMHEALISNHNKIVHTSDITIHAGDFAFVKTEEEVHKLLRNLNGTHVLLRGSHDKWMGPKYHEIWSKRFKDTHINVCHYPMYSWPCSHWGSFLLYGHHHGRLSVACKAIDIGVDTNNFYPYALEQVVHLMQLKPDTPGTIKSR